MILSGAFLFFKVREGFCSMYNSADVTWTLVGAFLVFFMQAGFALCEAGLTRAKNTGNILMKNMMDFCIGTPCYWLLDARPPHRQVQQGR